MIQKKCNLLSVRVRSGQLLYLDRHTDMHLVNLYWLTTDRVHVFIEKSADMSFG